MIKNIILVFSLLCLSLSVQAQQRSETVEDISTKINWNKTIHDFGEIKQGIPATTTFEFTNIGSVPVIISEVETSCGCTSPFYTEKPVLPGNKGKIETRFSAAHLGTFNKTITVWMNSGETIKLMIRGTVVEN